MTANPHNLALEPAALSFAEATEAPPYLYQLPIEEGRAAVDEVQAGEIAAPETDVEDLIIPGGPTGEVRLRIVRPRGATGPLPVIVYLHGAGWVFGNAHTHGRLVAELAAGANAAVVFPEYDRSPEAQYPVPVEQNYTAAVWVAEHGAEHGLDPRRIAIAGDSAGGNMAAAVTLLATRRGTVSFRHQVLFYPVTDLRMDSESYRRFGEGYFLRAEGMVWFLDQYIPDHAQRTESTASPLLASLDELRDLPPALVITAEADVLRDEGEAYAARLREAGVPVVAVRYTGVIHDFVMLNALRETHAAAAAIAQAAATLKEALHA
ncbi:alpha/beta hydrolase [Prauserella muralis]|uniref:Esterase n=1 Tax=Prauserella muralis TaxID=588067 RepID=A0A2V4ANG0_9PSEU|nr:alpha/beta hydrolase [Prauserella muralis]PXY22240.1 esterase [Prauserella muralis]TWE27873.1 acetyl esterase/lipase [Prauserella muralis]